MNPDLEHLIVLQAQDLDLARLRTEIAEAPRRVQAAEAALRSAQEAAVKVRQSLTEEEKLRRSKESDIATQRSKLDRLHRSLDGASSAAQIAAFENEIRFSEAAIAKLEDDEYASLERTEALLPQQVQAEALQGRRNEELEAERKRSAQVIESNREQVAGVEEQRQQLRAQVSENWLSQYDRLSKSKGTALAEALGTATQGRCSACQMGVRPQRWRDLTGRDHEDNIFTCESCGRMLFWDPRRDTPKAWEIGDRLRRAQTGSSR